MNEKYFNLRLHSTYHGDENTIDELNVEILVDNKWELMDLNIRSAGFLLFINGLFSCQHLYMRANSAECSLLLESATGELQVDTDEDWHINNATVSFNARLRSGTPTQDNINYITERMTHCPVSSNLPDKITLTNTVNFEK